MARVQDICESYESTRRDASITSDAHGSVELSPARWGAYNRRLSQILLRGRDLMRKAGLLVAFTMLPAFYIQNGSCSTRPKNSTRNASPSAEANRSTAGEEARLQNRTVATGLWGGRGISLQVDHRGAQVEYDCAHGEITGPLSLNDRGEFEAAGKYVPETPGPTRVGAEYEHMARYAGRVQGDRMTLTVTLADTQEKIGTFTLEHGRGPALVKCQ